jgi:phosphoribosylaminoimidazolecarboxamide formyltransferase/IMP cyclohydrolase
MFKNALISVSDKSGLVQFLRPFVDKGMRVVSTGGTAKHLKEHGIAVVDVTEQTGFPEVMGGRVKTLHPRVHMGLLARPGKDDSLLKENGLEPFDLLVCNLYPFEESVKAQLSETELVEKIDVGGPSMLRAAAKNFSRMTVICDPKDYARVSEMPESNIETRKHLAAKVFAHTASYDSLIAKELGAGWGKNYSMSGHRVQELRYGENPQQNATWYSQLGNLNGLHSAKVLQGKELSYNNILDIDAACGLVQEFSNEKMVVAVAVKHTNPCGAAVHIDSSIALKNALTADPVSVFGGIVALSSTVEKAHAELLKDLFLECVVAPKFSPEALALLSLKKNLRLLEWPFITEPNTGSEMRTVNGGFVIQSKDKVRSSTENWQFQGRKPSPAEISDLQFGERVCAILKSNAVALVKNGQTLGLGMGQVNRVDSVKQAIERMQTHFGKQQDVILASDAFFPFPDSIGLAAQAGIKWILQPGGSVKDADVLAAAKKMKIEMVLTGERHFRH